MKKWKLWSNEEKELVKSNYPEGSIEDLKRIMPYRTYNEIRYKAKELGVKKTRRLNTKTNLSKLNSFDTLSCYWWGMLMSDGCFTERQLIFSLLIDDEEQVKKFAEYINGNVKYATRKNNFHKTPCTMARVCADSKFYFNKWKNIFKFNGAKTYNPPDLSIFFTKDKLMYFMIGFIDGDGCIFWDNRNKFIAIKSHRAWMKNFELIQKYMKFFYSIDSTIRIDKTGFIVFKIYGKDNMLKIKSFIKGLPSLERKWNKIP